MIPSEILPSSPLTLPCLLVGRLECYVKKKPSADKYSRHWILCWYWKEKELVPHFCNLKVLKIEQRKKPTLINDMWAPISIEISYEQAVMQVLSVFGL